VAIRELEERLEASKKGSGVVFVGEVLDEYANAV
jgi:predicted flavoprotein YhiN